MWSVVKEFSEDHGVTAATGVITKYSSDNSFTGNVCSCYPATL